MATTPQRALFTGFSGQFKLLAIGFVALVVAITFFVIEIIWAALVMTAIFLALVVAGTMMSVGRAPTPEQFPDEVAEKERLSPPEEPTL